MRFWAVVLAVALLVCAFGAGGCSVIAKKAVESATGIKVDDEGDTVTIKGEDGSEVTMNSGEGKLAAGFPDNIPIYNGKILDSAGFTGDDGSTWTATIETSDSVDDIRSFYEEGLAAEGWKITFNTDSTDSSGGRMAAYSAEANDLSMTVSISMSDGKTTIGILAGTKQE